MKKALFLLLWTSVLLMGLGCSTPAPAPQPVVLMPLPQRTWVNLTYALRTINERAQQVENVLAVGEMSLTAAGGKTLQMQVALLTEGNDHVRLRAWQGSQPAVDIMMTPMGWWVWQRERVPALPMSLGQMSLLGSILRGDLPLTGEELSQTTQAAIATGLLEGEIPVRFRIHKDTATTRELAFMDEGNQAKVSLVMDEYDLVNYQPWPRRVRVVSRTGQMVITWREVEINQSLPSAAFTPNPQATRVR